MVKERQGYKDRQGHNTFPGLHDDVRVRPMLPLWGGVVRGGWVIPKEELLFQRVLS